jgi:hypothetical protein
MLKLILLPGYSGRNIIPANIYGLTISRGPAFPEYLMNGFVYLFTVNNKPQVAGIMKIAPAPIAAPQPEHPGVYYHKLTMLYPGIRYETTRVFRDSTNTDVDVRQ